MTELTQQQQTDARAHKQHESEELQKLRNSTRLFIYPMDIKIFDSKIFKISAYLQAGISRKKENMTIELKEGYYELKPVKKNKFAVYLNVENTVSLKKDLLRFVF